LDPTCAATTSLQSKLEAAYKSELHDAFGIEFNTLLCLNNMPIKRYADWLIVSG
jgi:hypothetical protein